MPRRPPRPGPDWGPILAIILTAETQYDLRHPSCPGKRILRSRRISSRKKSLSNYQSHVQAYLKYLIPSLYQESGTMLSVAIEARKVSFAEVFATKALLRAWTRRYQLTSSAGNSTCQHAPEALGESKTMDSHKGSYKKYTSYKTLKDKDTRIDIQRRVDPP